VPKTIRQAVTFRAAPARRFDIYLSSRKHSAATGARAVMSRKVGGVLVFTRAPGGGRIAMTHVNVPDANVASITRGWDDYYWKPFRKYLERSRKGGRR
jgi:hypothetical protein